MRKLHAIAASVLLLAQGRTGAECGSQSSPSSHGYAFFAAGNPFDDPGSALGVGGGGEGFLRRGWSLGGDLGYLFPTERPSAGIGLASLSTGYHFGKDRRLAPFLAGGYSLGFRSGVGHFFHFGGGATYWFSGRIGFRAEIRDLRLFEDPRAHLWMVRLGPAFR
jgi:hypothetical protein